MIGFKNKGENNYPLCLSAVANEPTPELQTLQWFSFGCSGDGADPGAEVTRTAPGSGNGEELQDLAPSLWAPKHPESESIIEGQRAWKEDAINASSSRKSRIWAAQVWRSWWTQPGCMVVAGSMGFLWRKDTG